MVLQTTHHRLALLLLQEHAGFSQEHERRHVSHLSRPYSGVRLYVCLSGIVVEMDDERQRTR